MLWVINGSVLLTFSSIPSRNRMKKENSCHDLTNVTELGCLTILQEPCHPHWKMDHNTFSHYKSGSILQQCLNMYVELRNEAYQKSTITLYVVSNITNVVYKTTVSWTSKEGILKYFVSTRDCFNFKNKFQRSPLIFISIMAVLKYSAYLFVGFFFYSFLKFPATGLCVVSVPLSTNVTV